jgi:plasmid stability protein
MPTTLTLKGIPDEVYARLKESAAVHRRSLSSEIISHLEVQVMSGRISAQQHLAAIRAARARLHAAATFDHADIDRFKRQGRA